MRVPFLHIALFQPEIPPNTGNIIRLCANVGCELHLIKPLGFPLDDTKLRRAGLDYHEYINLVVHENWQRFKLYFQHKRIIAIETCGSSCYSDFNYKLGDVLLFGSETKGLSKVVLDDLQKEYIVKLPMQNMQRSLNLSNSVGVATFEAWRQLNFIGGI